MLSRINVYKFNVISIASDKQQKLRSLLYFIGNIHVTKYVNIFSYCNIELKHNKIKFMLTAYH